ncbi:aromatic ring-hydroxylating dioxygenase subunit alpha [Novosphingobium sp. ERN07]|uniref:aromatic ring-hydroxylating dioxygenase subunit alpha n=1 Tax=Novosphingobium sp. ERN07 TaxID=2726187 RepID=UPI0014577554|nr:aromatic ring-hydroxylating dioxygenase subunit alpha [Novosphingobium sp. ERN07]NLR69479.1 aromatic ring-hydroxylating dioxygenase subunit alpha [Novosphingobium sp. ERN07]
MIHVRNAWHVACWAMDLQVAKPFALTMAGDPVVIFRTEGGRLVALEDRCVHRLAPLSLGRCEGESLRCMYHGFRFAADGTCVEIPGQDMIPASARVRSYPVQERHSWIWVWLGDPAKADPALIPQAVGFDDPDYILGRGQLDYAANAQLIHDNLCDFTHLAFVHPASFGADEEWARTRPKVTQLPRGVRFERWVRNQSGGRSGPERVDVWSCYEYHAPGILLMPTASYPVGTADRLGDAPPPPDLPKRGVTFTSQAVTALTDTTSRYFFSWGPHRDHGDEALRDLLMGLAAKAFAEDKTMIEAQQRVIDIDPSRSPMPATFDKGVVLYQRLVERLAREEALEAAG